MAIVKWNSAIDYASGALSKPKKQNGHSHGDYLIATHRVAPTTNPNCNRAYIKGQDAYNRSTPVTADEMAIRNRFAAVARMVKTRRNDPTRMAGDLVSFNEQKDLPNGKKTMTAYLWMVCGLDYDAQQG